MPRKKGFSHNKGGLKLIRFERLIKERNWLRNVYMSNDTKLSSIGTEFKKHIVEELLTKLQLYELQDLYTETAWSAILNAEDLKLLFNSCTIGRRKKANHVVEKLISYFMDNVKLIHENIRNRISSIFQNLKANVSTEQLFWDHVWFNYNEQLVTTSTVRGGPYFKHTLQSTVLKKLSLEEMQLECGISIWNALMLKALGDVIRNRGISKQNVKEQFKDDNMCSLDVDEIKIENTTVTEEHLLDCRLCDNLPKQLTAQDQIPIDTQADIVKIEAEDFSVEAPLPLDAMSNAESTPKRLCTKRAQDQKLIVADADILESEVDHFSVDAPLPLDVIPNAESMPSFMKPLAEVREISKGTVEFSWNFPYSLYGLVGDVIIYEVFMLNKAKFRPNLSSWCKISLIKGNGIPTVLKFESLRIGITHYFTVRAITNDNKVSPVSDIIFIIPGFYLP